MAKPENPPATDNSHSKIAKAYTESAADNKDFDRDMRYGREGVEGNKGIAGDKNFGSVPSKDKQPK